MNEWVDDALTIARALAEFDNHELHDLSPADQDRYGRQAVFVVERIRTEAVARREREREALMAQATQFETQGGTGYAWNNPTRPDNWQGQWP